MEERIEIMSFDVLQDKIRGMKNPTVAGLDARIDYVPEQIRTACFEEYGKTVKGAAEAIYQFNCGLMDALCDIVPAVKPQSAYYENLGWQGMEVLERTIRYAKSKGFLSSLTLNGEISVPLPRHTAKRGLAKWTSLGKE